MSVLLCIFSKRQPEENLKRDLGWADDWKMVAVPMLERVGRWMFGKMRVIDKPEYAVTYCTSCVSSDALVSSSILQLARPLLGS